MSASLDYDVAIAGAGIVGASIAYHLALRGMRVVIVDATGPAAAASGASDGAVSVASKKPGVMARLATASLVYTRELARNGGPLSGAFAPRPGFFFATDPAEESALDMLIGKLNTLETPVCVTGDQPGADGLCGLGPTVSRLVTLTGEGHMLGYEAVRAYLSAAPVDKRWPSSLLGWEAGGTSVTIRTGNGSLRVGKLVLALGVSSPELVSGLPVVPRAGQLVVTDRAQVKSLPGALTAASYLMAKTGGHEAMPKPPVVVDPLSTGQFLVGSSREDHGDPSRISFATIRSLIARAVEVWPALRKRQIVRIFTGIRAAVTDSLPIVGPLADTPRVFLATGFEGDGICLSAVIGREVAAMVCDEPCNEALVADLLALSPSRFHLPGGCLA
ncbi:MAG: FAD-binding oxidoreductase [Oricola sp.]